MSQITLNIRVPFEMAKLSDSFDTNKTKIKI